MLILYVVNGVTATGDCVYVCVHTLPIQNCSFFNSKTVPLKLSLKNADQFGSNINVIFKVMAMFGVSFSYATIVMAVLGWFKP